MNAAGISTAFILASIFPIGMIHEMLRRFKKPAQPAPHQHLFAYDSSVITVMDGGVYARCAVDKCEELLLLSDLRGEKG